MKAVITSEQRFDDVSQAKLAMKHNPHWVRLVFEPEFPDMEYRLTRGENGDVLETVEWTAGEATK